VQDVEAVPEDGGGVAPSPEETVSPPPSELSTDEQNILAIWAKREADVQLLATHVGVPSMNCDLEVQVLWGLDRGDPSEPQGDDREGIAERSG
jgi:hypothetical protein